jgi:hypothetical protein
LFAAAALTYVVFIVRCTFTIRGEHGLTLFDDAMISMRYARNLVERGELTWNIGDPHVEGYTNLLWTLWMAVGHLLPVDDLHASYFVATSGAFVLLGTGVVVVAIARRFACSPTATAAAAGATLFSYALVYWTLRGMEVGLLALLATAGLALLLRLTEQPTRRDVALLAACAVAALLTRTDSVAFIAVWIGYSATCLPAGQRRRVAIVLVTVTAATLAVHTLFRWAYYGALMPNTYYLKLEGIPLATRLARGGCALGRLLQDGWALPCVLAGFAFADSRHRAAKVLLAAQVAACGAYSVYVGGDAWEEFAIPNRYLSAALPALFVLAMLGATSIALSRKRAKLCAAAFSLLAAFRLLDLCDPALIHAMPSSIDDRLAGSVYLLALAGLVLWRPTEWVLAAALVLATTAASWRDWFEFNAAHLQIDIQRVRHGLAIREATSPLATVATTPCGSIPYFARRRTLDLLGKSDVRIAHEPPHNPLFHPGHAKWDYSYSIGELQPDLIDELFIPPDTKLVAADVAKLPAWGYARLTRSIYVRRTSILVDPMRLQQLVSGRGVSALH